MTEEDFGALDSLRVLLNEQMLPKCIDDPNISIDEYKEICKMKKGPYPLNLRSHPLTAISALFVLDDGCLRWKEIEGNPVLICNENVNDVSQGVHEMLGHTNYKLLYKVLKRSLYYKGMKKALKEVETSCAFCAIKNESHVGDIEFEDNEALRCTVQINESIPISIGWGSVDKNKVKEFKRKMRELELAAEEDGATDGQAQMTSDSPEFFPTENAENFSSPSTPVQSEENISSAFEDGGSLADESANCAETKSNIAPFQREKNRLSDFDQNRLVTAEGENDLDMIQNKKTKENGRVKESDSQPFLTLFPSYVPISRVSVQTQTSPVSSPIVKSEIVEEKIFSIQKQNIRPLPSLKLEKIPTASTVQPSVESPSESRSSSNKSISEPYELKIQNKIKIAKETIKKIHANGWKNRKRLPHRERERIGNQKCCAHNIINSIALLKRKKKGRKNIVGSSKICKYFVVGDLSENVERSRKRSLRRGLLENDASIVRVPSELTFLTRDFPLMHIPPIKLHSEWEKICSYNPGSHPKIQEAAGTSEWFTKVATYVDSRPVWHWAPKEPSHKKRKIQA